jgi:endoribonuclease Nob1
MKTHKNEENNRVIVLDTSAFIAGFDIFSLSVEQVTVPKVKEEIQVNSMVLMRFNMAIESGKLKIKAPSEEFTSKVKTTSNKVGDSFLLSKTDIQLLALALELKNAGYTPQLITDDYSIQNVATQMGIEFVALSTFGIKRLLEWIRYCPACHKQYPANRKSKECQICGTELKRKPRRDKNRLIDRR